MQRVQRAPFIFIFCRGCFAGLPAALLARTQPELSRCSGAPISLRHLKGIRKASQTGAQGAPKLAGRRAERFVAWQGARCFGLEECGVVAAAGNGPYRTSGGDLEAMLGGLCNWQYEPCLTVEPRGHAPPSPFRAASHSSAVGQRRATQGRRIRIRRASAAWGNGPVAVPPCRWPLQSKCSAVTSMTTWCGVWREECRARLVPYLGLGLALGQGGVFSDVY